MKSIFLLIFVSVSSLPVAFADPMGMNEAICRTPQYFECFKFTQAECLSKVETPLAYCYRAMGLSHPMNAGLKPVTARLKRDPGISLGMCGEATYYWLFETRLVKSEKCNKLMSAERGRWSAEFIEFAKQVQAASK